jgi:hypothetical protein
LDTVGTVLKRAGNFFWKGGTRRDTAIGI